MRPTGAMHLGHYHGALKNWVRLQNEHECFFFVADWHALTTHYEEREVMERYVYDMVVDWIAAGLDPEKCTIFIQSRLPEHAELFTLLAMGTPLGWLERVPTYKDQIDKLKDRDLATYGFLGYPLLQAADILIYKANYVPVGEDQSSHVELTREVARRFNNLYGRSKDSEARIAAAMAKLSKDDARYYDKQRKAFGETGSAEALAKGEGMVIRKAAASVSGWAPRRQRPAAGASERQWPQHPDRATGAAHRGSAPAWPGWHQDEQELRQCHPDAGHAGGSNEEGARHGHRPARGRRTDPATPTSARCGSSTSSTAMKPPGTGWSRAARARASAAWTASSR
jgi:tryptophanyl-tRNA synthetase